MRTNTKPTAVSPTAARIGRRIFARRTELGMTQAAVRTKAGLSPAHFCDIENGKVRVGAENLLKIAKSLKMTIGELTK